MTSAPFPAALLDDAFGLADHSYLFFIGGGGKTTLMFTLARHLAQSGRTVVSTTSTKILRPSPADAACVIVEADPAHAAARLRSELPRARHVTVAKTLSSADGKLHGYSADELDELRRSGVADYIIVEADGAAGRSLKAHNDYEPVVSAEAEGVIVVIGSDCLGCPLSDAYVHRAERFAELVRRPLGAPVTAEDVAAIFFHPRGYLKSVPPQAAVRALLTKAGPRRAAAQRLAAALRAADRHARIARIIIGELTGPSPFLEAAGY